MKNKTFWILSVIFIVSILLRLWGLDSQPLWHDEYVSYNNAINPFWQIQKITMETGGSQPPLYFWFLWAWMKIFGNSDWVLRLLSVVFDSITVIVAYFCGKQFELTAEIDEPPGKTGIIFSALFAISTWAIYYSHEARPYSLIILLSMLLLFAILKITSEFNNKNLFFLICVNLLLLYSHTLAYAFCFLEILALLVFFYRNNRVHLKKLVISFIILGILCLPVIYDILHLAVKNQQSWTKFSFNTVFSMLNDYISPFLFNLNGQAIDNGNLFLSSTFLFLSVFSLPLIIIYIASVINTIITVPISRYLSLVCILYLSVLAVLNIQGRIPLLPRYGSETFPFLLLFTSYGLTLFKNRLLNTKFLVIYIMYLNLIFMFWAQKFDINAQYLKKAIHPTNFKDLSGTLNKYKFKQGDIFLIVYYGATYRYVSAPKYYDFSRYKTYIVDGCAFHFNKQKWMEISKANFSTNLETIKKDAPPDKNLVIVIPSDMFETYQSGITNANLAARYKNAVKLDENNWVTLVYYN